MPRRSTATSNVSVTDTGPGIPEHERARIFEQFPLALVRERRLDGRHRPRARHRQANRRHSGVRTVPCPAMQPWSGDRILRHMDLV